MTSDRLITELVPNSRVSVYYRGYGKLKLLSNRCNIFEKSINKSLQFYFRKYSRLKVKTFCIFSPHYFVKLKENIMF